MRSRFREELGEPLIKKGGIEYRIIYPKDGKKTIDNRCEIVGCIKGIGDTYRKVSSAKIFFDKKVGRAYLSGTNAPVKKKGYGPAIMEIRNRFILGDLKIKPPFKVKEVNASSIVSPTVAQKHVDLGLVVIGTGKYNNIKYQTPKRDDIEKLFKSMDHEKWKEHTARYGGYISSRSVGFTGETKFMKERLQYLKKHGRGLGNVGRIRRSK